MIMELHDFKLNFMFYINIFSYFAVKQKCTTFSIAIMIGAHVLSRPISITEIHRLFVIVLICKTTPQTCIHN